MRPQLFLLLLLFSLLTASTTSAAFDEGDDEDLRFLESLDDVSDHHHHLSDEDQVNGNDFDDSDDYDYFDDSDVPSNFHDDYDTKVKDDVIKVNDKDVVVLVERNFSDVIEENRYVMVEFYAPWCGNCKMLAPEYAVAATELKAEDVVLAKVDATVESELAGEYRVQGFPSLFFFVDGEYATYNGQRTKEAIVSWVRKKTGPGIRNITTIEEAERILTSESKVVLGYLDSLVGPETEELIAASKLEDNVNFYQSSNPDVAQLFHMDSDVKRPALVMLKREAEKVTHYGDGKFTRSAISKFVTANKLPLVITFARESGSSIFESPIKKQVMLFSTSKESEKVLPGFQEAAKYFKGKLLFVHIKVDDEEDGRPVAKYFGISGDAPKVIGYLGNDDSRKYIFDGQMTLEKLKEFAEGFLTERLKPIYKSDPIPQTNDEDVKIVVGNSFDDVVFNESKDVLLEIYTPWCSHCRTLEPTYNTLAKHLRGIKSLVIAKMDGSTNEHPRAKVDGFPTLLFFPAGNKTSDPITVETDRTVVALYKFLRRHASIPFKLQKPAANSDSESSDVNERVSSDTINNEYKDDL